MGLSDSEMLLFQKINKMVQKEVDEKLQKIRTAGVFMCVVGRPAASGGPPPPPLAHWMMADDTLTFWLGVATAYEETGHTRKPTGGVSVCRCSGQWRER